MTPETAYRAIAYEHVTDVTEEEALEIIKNQEGPIAINFWKDDCPPCNLMKPKLRLAAREYHEKLDIYSVKLTDGSMLEEDLNITEIPTILVYNEKGKVAGRLQGLANQNEIVSAFERALSE